MTAMLPQPRSGTATVTSPVIRLIRLEPTAATYRGPAGRPAARPRRPPDGPADPVRTQLARAAQQVLEAVDRLPVAADVTTDRLRIDMLEEHLAPMG